MAQRFTTSLVDTARASGMTGARICHRRSGPRLLGCLGAVQISIPLPGTAGQSLSNAGALRRLAEALVAARQTGGPVAPWPPAPSGRRRRPAKTGGHQPRRA
jgi:hypothetical protein